MCFVMCALPQCLVELKAEGVEAATRAPGLHDPLEPEYSILKQRLARRIRYEKLDPNLLDLPTLTQVRPRGLWHHSAPMSLHLRLNVRLRVM